jgi:uncharacterized protein YnzC (UPF0291/DUF896 family)
MDPKILRGLTEAYTAVYNEELRDELEEMADDFAGIEDLSDEEIDAIVEETIDEMIVEGYDFEDVEEIFEEVLSEATVTTGRGGYTKLSSDKRSAPVTTGSGSRMAASSRLSAAKAAKREAKVAQVKASVKKKVAQVKAAPAQAKAAAQKKVKDVKQQSHVAAAKYASSRKLMPGAGLKTQSSKGRRELRAAVAKDIKGRIKHKIAKAQVGAYAAARKAGQAASDVAGRAKQSAKNIGARTKRGIKGAIKGAAEKVASGATKVAQRMSEDMDMFDVMLEYLIDEGYAETNQDAIVIMANMSEEWREEIIQQLDEISADLALRASKAADVQRGKLAHAGDTQGASSKAAQAKRLYDKQAAKRLGR